MSSDTESRNANEFIIIGCTGSCRNDNFLHSHWCRIHQRDDLSFWASPVFRCLQWHIISEDRIRTFLSYFINCILIWLLTIWWRHNGHDGVSNHQPRHCLFNRLFGCRSKKTSTLCVSGLCAGNSPGTGEFPAQMASNAENVSIWWRHHEEI